MWTIGRRKLMAAGIFADNAAVPGSARRLIDATIEEGANLLSPLLYARRGGKTMVATE